MLFISCSKNGAIEIIFFQDIDRRTPSWFESKFSGFVATIFFISLSRFSSILWETEVEDNEGEKESDKFDLIWSAKFSFSILVISWAIFRFSFGINSINSASFFKDTDTEGDVTADRGRDRGGDDGEKEVDGREGDNRGDTIGFVGTGTGTGTGTRTETGTGTETGTVDDPQKLKRRRIPLFCFCATVEFGFDDDTLIGADSGSIKMRESDILSHI